MFLTPAMSHRLVCLSACGFLLASLTACVNQVEVGSLPAQSAPITTTTEATVDIFSEDAVRSPYIHPGLTNARCDLQAAQEFQEEALRALNGWREKEQICGAEIMPATPAMRWNVKLQTAAFEHSAQMAATNLVSHTSLDSRQLRDRMNDVGYRFAMVGENITAGPASLATAMQAWFDSPQHCKQMLSREFTEFAVACVSKKKSFYKSYWTMNLGRLRPEPIMLPAPEAKE